MDPLGRARGVRGRDARRAPRQGGRREIDRRSLGPGGDDVARSADAARTGALSRAQPEHAGDPESRRRVDEARRHPFLGRRAHLRDVRGNRAGSCRPRPRAQGGDARGETHAPARLLRRRHAAAAGRHAVAGTPWRQGSLPAMILTLLSMAWSSELAALVWLGAALVAAIIEVSVPHFGFGFVSIGAVAGAGMAYFGYGVTAQMAVFVVVLSVSLLALRSTLLGTLMG